MQDMRFISCLRFSMQLLIAESVFTAGWKKRDRFFMHLAAGIVIYLFMARLIFSVCTSIPSDDPIIYVIYYFGLFACYKEAVAAPVSYELKGVVMGNGTYDPTAYDLAEDEMPVTGAKNDLELYDLRGADYDDPRWEQLLDQMSVDDMVELIAFGGHQNAAVNSVGKIRILDTDGPAGVNSSTLGVFGTGYCSEVVLAQTWNTDLAEEYAKTMGEEFADFHITGWYAPSMNMHRSAFGGRDFEYYSEDPVISAAMAVGEVKGAVESGMYPFIKHFALNEQEINRNALLCTWITEQAMREIYLKPFEEVVKSDPDGKIAVMSSYNFIGTEWAGGCAPLLKEVLRGEWGFKGMVISDYFGNLCSRYYSFLAEGSIWNGCGDPSSCDSR